MALRRLSSFPDLTMHAAFLAGFEDPERSRRVVALIPLVDIGALDLPPGQGLGLLEHLFQCVAVIRIARQGFGGKDERATLAGLVGGGKRDLDPDLIGRLLDRKFGARDYRAYDVFKLALLHDEEISWWLKQNMMLLAKPGLIDATSGFYQFVHPRVYKNMIRQAQYSRRYEQLVERLKKEGQVTLKLGDKSGG